MEVSTVCCNGGGLLELSDDVHREILFRLPARSLCRARAVCRSWRDLASDPSFLRAYADRTAASAPVLLTWSDTVNERDGTRDCTVHLRIHHQSRPRGDNDDRHGRSPASYRCCDLRLVLTARHPSISGAMRSWDGILCVEMWVRPPPASSGEHHRHIPCSYLLLNPISMACTAVSAPALCAGSGGKGKPWASRSDRGYIAGAYSHPVSGVFHLLHSSGSVSVLAGVGEQTPPRFRLLTVDAPGAAWREIPISADAETAWLQTVVGRLRLQSSATAHGRLHWRVSRSQTKRWHDDREKLLVFDAANEEFGCMALPQLHLPGEAEAAAVKQLAISTLAAKLCLLAGVASTTVAVWVLEDFEAQDWRLRHMVDIVADSPWPLPSPLHWDGSQLGCMLGNVGLLAGGLGGDEVDDIIFYNCSNKVYKVRPWSPWFGSTPRFFGHREGLAVHMQSLLPHNVVFGTMPRLQGVAFLDCPDSNS